MKKRRLKRFKFNVDVSCIIKYVLNIVMWYTACGTWLECLIFCRFPDPEYIRKPVANITGDVIVIDWSKSFRLNGPLSEYILYENEVMIFRGISTDSGNLPDRIEAGTCVLVVYYFVCNLLL